MIATNGSRRPCFERMAASTTNRLALGTVQLGLPYGIANRSGQVSANEASQILSVARAAGIDTLDTAIAYGESEIRLGSAGVSEWRIVSKLPAIPADCANVAQWTREHVQGSLQRLGVTRLHGLLLHRSQEWLGPHGAALYAEMRALKEEGMVASVGVSIYEPSELESLWGRHALDLVQAPFNIADRRLATSGWLARLHASGTEVHVRSAFLQGLLLMPPGERPAKFDRWNTFWSAWHSWLRVEGLSALEACIGFALSQAEIDRVVVGVEEAWQLREILDAAGRAGVVPPVSLAVEDPDLLNPSRWSSL